MPLLQIDFEWGRDERGYRLVPAEPIKAAEIVTVDHPVLGPINTTTSLLERAGRAERIVRRGGLLRSYRPLEAFPTLFGQYAEVRTPKQLMEFATKFGSLTADGSKLHAGEEVEPLLRLAATMKRLLVAHAQGRRAHIAKAIGDGIPFTSPMAAIHASLVLPPRSRQPQLKLSVPNLLAGLWIQLGQFLSGGHALRVCMECGVPFPAGPGTGRRLDARFCSDKHRITFNSLKRSQKD